MSVCVSSRTRTGNSRSPPLRPRPKRVTSPVDSRIAGRVDVAQEVVALVAEARLHGPGRRGWPGSTRDRTCRPGSAPNTPTHMRRRAARRQLAALVADLLQLAHQRRACCATWRFLGGVFNHATPSLAATAQRLAVLGQFEIDGVHLRLPGLEHARVEPIALTSRQGLQSKRQAIERDGAAVAIGHLAQAEALDGPPESLSLGFTGPARS